MVDRAASVSGTQLAVAPSRAQLTIERLSAIASRIGVRQLVLVAGGLCVLGTSAVFVAQGIFVPLGVVLAADLLLLARLVPTRYWVSIWLAVGGVLGTWFPVLQLPAGLPDLTLERVVLGLLLAGTLLRRGSEFSKVRLGAGAACIALFSLDYLGMGLVASPSFGQVVPRYLHHYLPAFAVYGLAATNLRLDAHRGEVFRTGTLVGGLMAVIAFVQPFMGWNLGTPPGWEGRIAGTQIDPPVLGSALSILFFFGLAEAARSRGRRRTTAVIACVLMTVATFLTYTRGAWLSVLAGVVVLAMFNTRRHPRVAIALVGLTAFLLVVGPTVIDILFPDNARLLTDVNAVGRLDTTLLSWQIFLGAPLFGWGPLTVSTFSVDSGYSTWVSHNSFLTLLVATGSLGFVLYSAPIVLGLFRAVTTPPFARTPADPQRAFLVAGMAAYVVSASAIDMQFFSYPHGLFWLCVAMLAAGWRSRAALKPEVQLPGSRETQMDLLGARSTRAGPDVAVQISER